MRNLVIPNSNNNYNPYLLRKGFLSLTVVLIIIFNILFSALGLVSINAYVDFDSIYNFHNQERVNHSLGELTVNPLLVESATQKAEAMLESDCWSHYCPDGKSPWDFFDNAGYSYIYAGENLGEGFSENETLMSAWMNSPTHRDNILNGKFSEIGIGFAKGDYQGIKNNTIVVVHFGSSNKTSVKAVETNIEEKVQEVKDTTPPVVGFDDFSVKLLTKNNIEQYTIEFSNKDVVKFDVIDSYSYKSIGKNSWEIDIPKYGSENIFSIVTLSQDLNENETKYELPFKELITKVQNIDVKQSNSDVNVFSRLSNGISQNPKTQLNVSVMIFLTGLFGIDFYILEKSGKTNIQNTNRHVFLLLIILSLFLLVITSTGGQILEGVTF